MCASDKLWLRCFRDQPPSALEVREVKELEEILDWIFANCDVWHLKGEWATDVEDVKRLMEKFPTPKGSETPSPASPKAP